MNLHQIFLVLKARYRLILAILFATVVAALAVMQVLPPKYKATTTLVIDFKSVDPITGAFLPVQLLLSSYMATEIDILESQTVALRAVKILDLANDPESRRTFEALDGRRGTLEDWLANGLRSKLEVRPSRESRIIEVNFSSPDPEYSARVANAIAKAYIETNLAMKVAPARESATWFDSQLKQLRDQLDAAQARLSQYQSERGITSSDQKLDVEVTRLSELSSQLVQAQSLANEGASRQRQLEDFGARGQPVDSLPEVLASPVIQDLKSRLSAAESRLSQASNSLGVNHPEYLRGQSEVMSLRNKLRDEIKTASSVISNNLKISQSRERELREAVAHQKARLLDLNRRNDNLGTLMKEVDNAQRAYDAASQRHTQTSMESRIDQGNATLLAAAVPPAQPVFPRVPIILALALGVGGVLGIAFALLAEMVDRRVRGVEDMVQAAGAQVWGVLANTLPVEKGIERRKKRFMKRPRTLAPVREPTLE